MDKQLSIWASNYINTFTSKIISSDFNFNLNIKFNIQFIITNNKMSTQSNMNSKKDLVKLLQLIVNKITADNEKAAVFKIKQYTDALKSLETYPHNIINNINDIKEWFAVNGKKNPEKILKKIEEFIITGTIQEAELARKDPRVLSVIELTKIYGIGPAKAKELYQTHNIITLDDLAKLYSVNSKILNNKQAIGLKYFNELEQRIPRSEMDEYYTILNKLAKDIAPDMLLSINGSYRRGQSSSGDIDVLISGPEGKNSIYRNKLKEQLIKLGIIEEILADGQIKFMGITRLSKKHVARHMDLMDTSINTYPFAILYFTGSGGFNVIMRNKALALGYSLNEYCISDKNTKDAIPASLIYSKIGKNQFDNEKDIFKFLDMDYVEPSARDNYTISKSC
jgi:DNA polymerase beta